MTYINNPVVSFFISQFINLRTFFQVLLLLFAVSGFSQTPDAPTGLTAIAGKERALITFSAPVNDGGSAITNYEYSTDDGVSWTARTPASADPSILISSLNNCSNYSIKVRAINSVGAGVESNAVTTIPRSGVENVLWTSRTAAASLQWQSVTYGNGLFVAVAQTGTGNRVMTSTDGVHWTSRASAADIPWSSVTYGNGLFVAVASNGTSASRVMTSPDGINWTLRSAATASGWNSVTYGNGMFVAVSVNGIGNRVMTSADGITWTSRISAADNWWNSVTYGNGMFVAVSSSGTGNRVMTSPDGIIWTSQSSAADNSWTSVTYGGGLFVAVANSGTGDRVMTSPDGIIWTSRISPVDNSWRSVAYGNGLFVAVATTGSGNRVMSSADGIDWTTRSSPDNISWMSVTYGNGFFVSVSNSGGTNRVMTSFDALVPDKPLIGSITPGIIDLTVALTAGNAGSSAINNYEYSVDNGSNWVAHSPASTSSPLVIAGLAPITSYQVQLRAVNTQGSGCASSTVNTMTNNYPPVIASFTPTSGCAGSASVTISGDYFTGATAVTIGGTAVSSFTVNSENEITVSIGSGTTGHIQVITPYGSTTSSDIFNVNAAPTWYMDADNDNYYTGIGITQCFSPGAGFKSTGLLGGADCNDAVSSINPGVATDLCNGLDDDCDSFIDEDALTFNTTTVTACDSYSWGVNGMTYTQSGSFTSVNGCITEILVLTVEKPQFSTQPSTISQKSTLDIALPAYSVTVSGGSGFVFQWYSNTVNSNSGGTLIPGAQSTTYQPSTQSVGLLYYYCKATTSNGCQVTSNPSGMVQVCGN